MPHSTQRGDGGMRDCNGSALCMLHSVIQFTRSSLPLVHPTAVPSYSARTVASSHLSGPMPHSTWIKTAAGNVTVVRPDGPWCYRLAC